VSAFDECERHGRVLLDDGTDLPFDADALDGTGLRLLRPGQRVRLRTEDGNAGPRILRVQILTLP